MLLCIDRGRYETILPGRVATPQFAPVFEKKKIRAAHAKEKQQIRETCNRPNRLNLLTWTAGTVWRSNLFTIFSEGQKPHRIRHLQR
jgi:hypothetical protein